MAQHSTPGPPQDQGAGTLVGMSAPDQSRPTPWSCRLFGHRLAFRAEGQQLVWECERGCGSGGTKSYRSAAEAARYAAAFDKRDNDDLGRRAPLIGMFPLRLWRRWRDGRR